MKISESWLRDAVNPSLTSQQLALQLTMAGLEVDGILPVAGVFENVIVAKVLRTEPHPQADKLTLCVVDAGNDRILSVVCGAHNVRPGLNVALALPGASLPGDVFIKETTLRGQLSQGMLCSTVELGLEDNSDGIIELAVDAPIGVDLRAYLGLNDFVFDLNLTPNRADCLSVCGIAREVAVLNNLPYAEEPVTAANVTTKETVAVYLDNPSSCPIYCGRVITGINTQAVTPLWMQERLRRGGIRAIHPVVDVTNYVMLELGQPMHAFNLRSLQGDIHVRHSIDGETLVLLNGQEIVLYDAQVVIADNQKPLSLAGVMGGEASAVYADTSDIFLESAFFQPRAIAGVARRYGLSSDSSLRFERGVDVTLQIRALERATELLQSIVGGLVGPITEVRSEANVPPQKCVLFNPDKVQQLTGLHIAYDEMLTMLRGLGMTVTQEGAIWTVLVPSYRFDINLDVDLIEEVARLYGYDNLTEEPLRGGASVLPQPKSYQRTIANFLISRGYHETINYSFVDPQLQAVLYPETPAMTLLNPISSELSQMRLGLWPGLIAAMLYNAHRQHSSIKCFEIGVAFDVVDNKPLEKNCVAGIMMGDVAPLHWNDSERKFDFYDLKGDLQALFALLNLQEIDFVATENPALHPGKSAQIILGGKLLGWIGVLHPHVLDALDLHAEVMVFELFLSSLRADTVPRYKTISKYPQTRRDLSFILAKEVSAAQIERAVRSVVDVDWLKTFDVFDVYNGDEIAVGKKSIGIALTLQDNHHTLNDIEINMVMDAAIKKLVSEFNIVLRTNLN